MKKLAMTAALALAGLGLTACGGGNGAGNGAGGGNAAGNAAHGHEHEGEQHALGKQSDKGIDVEVTQMGEIKASKECIFETKVSKDGKPLATATVAGWLGDDTGKELCERGPGEFNADEGLYDVHVLGPKEGGDKALYWVLVKDGATEIKVKFTPDRD
ncbi:MAG: hypothetical protein IT463_07990 [Planctomycetes bacterium]|nr:hypothetical protein [Planctomycetota bacterium]